VINQPEDLNFAKSFDSTTDEIEELYTPKADYDNVNYCLASIVSIDQMLKEIKQISNININDYLVTDKSFKNNNKDIVNGIFLYTDEDVKMIKYMRGNLEALNELTGKWSRIYILEEPTPSLKALKKYWKSILHAKLYKEWKLVRWITNTKPFNRNDSLKIAQQLSIPYDKFPCLVLLPPLTEISSQDKLIIPINKVSKEYFRYLFSTLESIVNYSQEANKYESIKIQFETIVKRLEEKSQKISTKTETKYELNGINIFMALLTIG
jgi:hypothetical protein